LVSLFVLPVTQRTRAAGPPQLRADAHGDLLPPGAVARMGSVRLWHGPSEARAVTFSPDSKQIAVLTWHGERQDVRVWRVADGRLERIYAVDGDTAEQLVYAPHGQTIAVWDRKDVRLIDLRTGKVTHRFTSDGQDFWCLAISQDGKALAVGCNTAGTGLIRRWDLLSGKEQRPLRGHPHRTDALIFSADGKRLFSGSSGHSPTWEELKKHPSVVCVWELPSGKLLLQKPFPSLSRGLHGFSPSGDAVLLSGLEGKYELWGPTSGKRKRALQAVVRDEYAPLFLPDGKRLITTNRKTGTISLWGSATGKKVRQLRGRLGADAYAEAISPDGKVLAARNDTASAVRLWDVASGEELRPAGGHTTAITALALGPDGRALISGSEDGLLLAWDTRTGKEVAAYGGHESAVTAIAFSPGGKWAVSGDASSAVRTWASSTGKLLHRTGRRPVPAVAPYGRLGFFVAPPHKEERGGIRALLLSADGKEVLDARVDKRGQFDSWSAPKDDPGRKLQGALSFRDFATGRELRSLRGEREAPLALATDGRTVIVEALVRETRSELRVKRLPSGRLLSRIVTPPHKGHVPGPQRLTQQHFEGLLLSADGKVLAADSRMVTSALGGSPGQVTVESRLWETATGGELLTLPPGRALAFSPDGRVLAMRQEEEKERTIVLLDTDTGKELGKLSGHFGAITCAVFSPDGKRLYSGSEDRTVLTWDVSGFRPAPARPIDLSGAALDRLWLGLADANAGRGAAAVRALAASPRRAVPMLRARLRSAPIVAAKTIAGHVDALASETFDERERAEQALVALGERAEPALWEALKRKPELDTVRRIERILAKRDEGPTPDRLRAIRATTALERMATPEPRRLLAHLARGAPGALLTEEAAAALRRLEARAKLAK
jgi:WD40 repeat protein